MSQACCTMIKMRRRCLLILALLFVPLASFAALQMHLPLDNSLNDTSGNGNNGVFPGGSSNPVYTNAVINEGLSFDGTNDFIRVPSFSPGNTFTVALWVKLNSFSSLNTFIEYVKTNNRNDFYLGYDNSLQQLFVELEDTKTTEGGSCGNPKFCTGIKLSTNRWYHLAATVTPTTLKVYVDGTLAYNTTHSTSVVFNPGTWLIGADSDSNPSNTPDSDFLNGRLDDIRIYNQELTLAEINSIIGITGSWQFDQCSLNGTANEVIDSSGHNYHGTAVNGATTTTGKICRGGLFDGSNDYIALPTLPNLTSSFTITAWIKPDVINKDQRIFVDDDNNSGGFAVSLGDGGNGHLRFFSRNINPVSLDSSAVISAGNWYFVAAVHNAVNKTRQIFVNGTAVTSAQTYTGTWGTDNGTAAIGGETNNAGSENSANWRFKGDIDEVKLYSRALNEDELNGYYTLPDPLTRSCPYCTGGTDKLVAYYKMDSGSWSGIPNEVLDASGNSNHANTVNGVSTVANGKVCRAGSIDSDGKAIDTKLDLNTAIGNKGTVSFWFRPNWTNKGNEKNTSRVLFDASLGDKYFKFAKTRNASDPPNAWRNKLILMFEDSSDRDVAVYSSDLSIFQTNTWVHLAVTWDYPDKKFEIYVNGSRVANQIIDSSGNTTSTLDSMPNLDTLYLGDNRSTYNPYNVTQPANGTFDEVYIYNSVRTQAEIQANMNATHSCGGLDHISIEHDGTALTCNPESVTVKACDSADCSALHTDPVSVTLSPAGWVGGDTQTINNGSATLQLRKTTAGTVTLGVTSSAPAATNAVQCYNTATSTSGDCRLNFHDSGFIYSVPDITACQSSASFMVQAVRKDATSQLCVPAFANRTATVNLWTTYSNPSTGTKSLRLTHNATNYTLATSTPGTPISLNFDANARAALTVYYEDAGQVTLNSSFTGTGSEAGLIMTGSDAFVSKPGTLYVYSDDANSDCTTADASCTAFRKTGQAFNLKVRAACNNAPTYTLTPNYRQNNIALTNTNIAPAVSNGALGVTSINFDATASGEVLISNQTLSEVGDFTITATPPALGYFGLSVTPGTSAYIGRFTPDHFSLSAPATLTNRSDITSCTDNFTYMDEDFRLAYLLQARNSSNTVTQNYTAGFAKLDPTLGTADFNYGATVNNTDYSARLSNDHSGSTQFINGLATIKDTLRLARATVLDGPLKPLAIGIAPRDSDGTLMQSYDLSLNGGGNTHTQIQNSTDIRSGRFIMGNAFGPQTLNLAIPAQAQYYDGSNFVLNTSDSCSLMNSGLISFDQWTENLSAADTQVFSINHPALSAGDAALILTAPNSLNTLDDNNGSVRVTTSVPAYLQYDWSASGSLQNPTAVATFGIYRGDDRIIFWKEIQN